MAIEDILQIKESLANPRSNPEGDPQAVNQMEFLRFQEQMGVGQKEVIGKLIKMFMEAPSDFTRQFGVESADAIRELMEMTTQKKLEEQGNVFRDNSAEIIGKNISMNLPENSAIGTLQTDQADKSEQMMEFMKQLQGEGQTWPKNQTTGRFIILNHDEAEQMGLPVDQGQIWELNQMTGQVNLLDTGDAEKPEWITKKERETTDWPSKSYWEEENKKEKNFLVDIMKDIIQGGMDTGSGIINAIMDEAKQLYREHTEKSPDYDPEFYEKEQLNETTEDYYSPGP